MPQNILGFGEQYLDKILILWYNSDSVKSCFIFARKYLEKAIYEDLGGSSYKSRRLLATNRKGRTGGIMNTKNASLFVGKCADCISWEVRES